jgi:formate hydrogenlyase subunit 3/multisubunit Na+/H+ antiporter MnhD subunit
MTALGLGLMAQLGLTLATIIVAFSVPARARSLASGISCALTSTAGALTGALALAGWHGSLSIPFALSADPVELAPTQLGGLFMLMASIVGILVSVYGIGYAHGATASPMSWAALAVFLVGMQLVPAAADAVSFLLMWEVMALGSTVLLLTEHFRRHEVNSAVVWYSAMSQVSFLLILAGFAVLATSAGSTSFAEMRILESDSWAAGIALVLLVLGFGSKAGLVPLNVWLPRAHPEAPSHISAAMSAAMVSMGVYGVLLACVQLLPAGPPWWGALIMVLGGVSAVYGIVQASVNSHLKVLLAHSTTENMGLVFLAIGASVLLRAYHAETTADATLLAALLLTLSHALFKTTLFLGAGAIQHATGEINLDRLGGLLKRMPWTAASFGVAALAAAALPVTSGFVAEWTLLQSLIHGSGIEGTPVAVALVVAMPLGVAVVALTAGVALLTFVKAFGIAFLARPRSAEAAAAAEVPASMRIALVFGALGILAVGILPGPIAEALASTVPANRSPTVRTVGAGGISIPGIGVLLDPATLVVLAALLLVPTLIIVRLNSRRHPIRVSALPWGGGGSRARPRMQYTATSYAEPLVRVFDDVLKPTRDVQVTHLGESRYLIERLQVNQRVTDVIETRLYRPVLNGAQRFGKLARHAQNGSIHRYLTYSFVTLLIVLVVVAL